MTKEEVLKLESEDNRIINCTGNKIEFANGDVYAMSSPGRLFYKVKCFVQLCTLIQNKIVMSKTTIYYLFLVAMYMLLG